jgi:hypothetical protein
MSKVAALAGWVWRPGGPPVVEPGTQRPVGELAEPLPVPADGDAAVGQIDVVQGKVADRGQRDDQALRGADGRSFNCPDLSSECQRGSHFVSGHGRHVEAPG